MTRVICLRCKTEFPVNDSDCDSEGIPRCPRCGARAPNVTKM